MSNTTSIFGAPGTGKTTSLFDYFNYEVQSNSVSPDNIAFITFAKSTAKENKIKAQSKGYKIDDLVNFGTLHSSCYKLLGVEKNQVVTKVHMKEFCNDIHVPFSDTVTEKEIGYFESYNEPGNVMFTIFSYARHNFIQHPDKNLENTPQFKFMDYVYRDKLEKWFIEWEKWKDKNELVDYTDMLSKCLDYKAHPNCSVLFVDEFQDFTPLQYEVYKIFRNNIDKTYIAGDDDQSMYSFFGARPNIFLDESCCEKIILPKTYRLPRNIWFLADRLINTVERREKKHIKPLDIMGNIKFIQPFSIEEILKYVDGKTFMLFRTNHMMYKFAEELVDLAVPYYFIKSKSIWSRKFINLCNAFISLQNQKDLEYDEIKSFLSYLPSKGLLIRGSKKSIKNDDRMYRFEEIRKMFNMRIRPYVLADYLNIPSSKINVVKKMLVRKEKISHLNIYLGTIHSSKGLEAETVILFDNISKRVSDEMSQRENRDMETRIFYVGCTRARKNLIVVGDFFKDFRFGALQALIGKI